MASRCTDHLSQIAVNDMTTITATRAEIREASKAANLPRCDRQVLAVLLGRALASGVIPDSKQPPSVGATADAAGYAYTQAAASLKHLEAHGWVIRQKAYPRVRYSLAIG